MFSQKGVPLKVSGFLSARLSRVGARSEPDLSVAAPTDFEVRRGKMFPFSGNDQGIFNPERKANATLGIPEPWSP